MNKENRFVSPPGALRVTKKKILITEEDEKKAEKACGTVADELNLTRIDEITLDAIRSKKRGNSNSPAIAHH